MIPSFTDRGKHDALLDRPLHERRVVPEAGRQAEKAAEMIGALKIKCIGRRAAGKRALGRKPAESRFRKGTPHGAVDLAL